MHLAAGKLMRSFVIVTDTLFYRWCLMQKAKAFTTNFYVQEREGEREERKERKRERERKKKRYVYRIKIIQLLWL